MTYQVTADVKYLDGALKGLLIPSGFRVSYPTHRAAIRAVNWICKTKRESDFVRAVGTGNKYEFASAPQVFRI